MSLKKHCSFDWANQKDVWENIKTWKEKLYTQKDKKPYKLVIQFHDSRIQSMYDEVIQVCKLIQ